MSYGEVKKQPFIPLLIIYLTALSLRLVPTLILGYMPFWDPLEHYSLLILYLQRQDATVFQQAHVGFHSFNIVVTTFTGIPTLTYARFFPPFFDSLTIIPIFLLAREILRKTRAALVASLFFGVTEIVVLRQSYLIPEGFAIYIMILIFYLILRTIYSQRYWSFAFTACLSFYCLCAFHNLTSAMTFLPLVAILFIMPMISILLLKRESVIRSDEFRKFLIVSIAFSFIWIFWAKEHQFIGFLSSFITLDIISMMDFITRQREPTPTQFTEHYIATREITILDLVAMNSGSLLIFFISIFGFLRLLRSQKKDFRSYFLLIWSVSMMANFIINILIDSMFGSNIYGQQAYRAWVFLIIPLIIIASNRIAEIKDTLIFQVILASLLLILSFGAIWFVGYLMDSFPHYVPSE